MDDLIQRLLLAESDLLVALRSGPRMLASYCQTLSTLLAALQTASENGSASHETLSLAHLIATRISKIATCFLDIRHNEEIFTAQLQSDCDAILHGMASLNIDAQPKSSHLYNTPGPLQSLVCSSTSISDAEGSSPPFLTSAYQWLLDNLHNPYPTAEVKVQIATASSCQVSSVNSWFTNTRRRIGWTTLCRESFSNCRADMIDAAYRALVEEDPQRALHPELRHSFVAMKAMLEALYSSTFPRSALAPGLDTTVEDVTKEDKTLARVGKFSQVNDFGLMKANRRAYPSLDPSSIASPMPALDDSFADESEGEVDVAPPIVAGSKRRRSSVEPVDQPSTVARTIKRLRASTTSQACFPSPSSSTSGTDEPSDHSSPNLFTTHSTLPETNEMLLSLSHKRRLSRTDSTGIPKHSCNSMVTPRLHIVSDRLPYSGMEKERSIDDWFHTNFDSLFAIPPPVDATELDISTPWEVELFEDYNIPGDARYAPKYPVTSMVDSNFSTSTNLSDFDSLLQSIGDDTMTSLPKYGSPSLSNIIGIPYPIPLDSSVPDTSQTSIDWTSLLDDTDTCQPALYSTSFRSPIHSQPLPEIDISVLQLPQFLPVVNSHGDLGGNSTSRQVKLHQLHVMQEAVRRIEHELQSEGVVI